jgi:very-short-patch-repair endonuclease
VHPTAAIPETLQGRPFTTAEAQELGLSRTVLGGRRFRNVFRGVWVCTDVNMTLDAKIAAARLVIPDDAVVSHVTALRVLGVGCVPAEPLHFSTNTDLRGWQPGIVLHRRQGTLHPVIAHGISTVGPDRAFVDSALLLSFRDRVRAGDELVRLGLTTPDRLRQYAEARHLDGVVRARRAAVYVRSRVDSVKETDLRLLLRFARLPEPEVNGVIVNDVGLFVARGDLVYRRFRVVVEYDGWHHERSARQRRKDILRRERLEAAGWTVVIVTVADMQDPLGIVRRVHAALVAGGYDGPAPVMSSVWTRWFTAA